MKKTEKFRTEKDTIGSIKVPFDCLWGAQTQRSIENFKIKNFEALEGKIKGLIIFRENENLRFYRDHNTKNILISFHKTYRPGVHPIY